MRNRNIATAGLSVLGVFIVGSLGWDAAQMAAAASPPRATVAAAGAAAQHINLTIGTPAMLGTEIGPAMMPSSLRFPANSDVTITITNFDDATALPASAAQYAVARGITGHLSIESMAPSDPNAAGVKRTADVLDFNKGVSHTFTIAKLGLNVPVAPKSKTTFTFHSGPAGEYTWQCIDPCGTGPTGWDGAMSTKGYMTGSASACGSGGCCC